MRGDLGQSRISEPAGLGSSGKVTVLSVYVSPRASITGEAENGLINRTNIGHAQQIPEWKSCGGRGGGSTWTWEPGIHSPRLAQLLWAAGETNAVDTDQC